MLVVFKQRGDIRMRKIGGIMRFRTQTAQFGLGVGDVGTQRLDGHRAVQLDIPALPYFAHTALRESCIETVSAVNESSFNEFHCCIAS